MRVSNGTSTRWGLVAAIGAAVAASACCTIPLLLVTLGLSGAWIGTLMSLEPFRPLFISLALGALGYAGYGEWRTSRGPACDCEVSLSDKLRRALLVVGFIAVAGLIASPWIVASAPTGDQALATHPVVTERVVLEVEGMTCVSCNVTVREALINLDGVLDAHVTFEPPQAVVTYDPARVSVEEMTNATSNAGYPSRLKATS